MAPLASIGWRIGSAATRSSAFSAVSVPLAKSSAALSLAPVWKQNPCDADLENTHFDGEEGPYSASSSSVHRASAGGVGALHGENATTASIVKQSKARRGPRRALERGMNGGEGRSCQPVQIIDDPMARLQRRIRSASTQMQHRTYSTAAAPAPVSPSRFEGRHIPQSTTVSHSDPRYRGGKFKAATTEDLHSIAQAREMDRQRMEEGLAPYTYKEPAGMIESMRKRGGHVIKEALYGFKTTRESGPSVISIHTHGTPQLRVLSSGADMERELRAIQEGEVLSFDMEWPVVFSKGEVRKTTVIQLASATRIFVLQVGTIQTLPKELIRIMADPTIIKCGVAVRIDALKLKRDFELLEPCANLVELSSVAKKVDHLRWSEKKGLISLRDLCRVYLNRKLIKDKKVQLGPWENKVLSGKQLEYAASDVYVGLEILHKLATMVEQRNFISLFRQNKTHAVMQSLSAAIQGTPAKQDLVVGRGVEKKQPSESPGAAKARIAGNTEVGIQRETDQQNPERQKAGKEGQ